MWRDEALEEMDLGPIWRLRGGAAPEAPASPPAREPRVEYEQSDLSRSDRIARMDWKTLREAVAGCRDCALCGSRRNTVFGTGPERARLLVVGEAPGQEEDATGEPFVGQAGRLLDAMLASIGMRRGVELFIANVLKCRPPGNRNPEPFEVEQCSPFLRRQIALLQPQLIVAMGRFAAQTLLSSEASIASLRSRSLRFEGVPLLVTYHPAYLLRTLADKAKAWEDLLAMRRQLAPSSG